MNKGKPSGFKADTKKDAGAKSTSRPREGQAGAGPEWTERNMERGKKRFDPSLLNSVAESDDAAKAVNPFPEIRNGASTNGDGKSQVIHFEFTDGRAEKVCIAGTFNDWHPNATEMVPLGDGKWRKDVDFAPAFADDCADA